MATTVSPLWDGGTASYSYDALDNLTRVIMPATQYAGSRDHHYCYDGSNRLTNVKAVSCNGATVIGLGYDVQGNLDQKDGTDYWFDYGNRLRGLYTNTGAAIETYRYDGLGRRVQARRGADALSVLSHYSRDGKLVYHYDQRASERIDYLYLGSRLVATRTRPISTATYTTEYQHTDALGSPVVATDAAGSRQRYDDYEPYGKRISRANDNRPGYTGHVMDEATGLTDMQQRYYDPGIGMFLSVDPVTAHSDPIGQFHRYRYANNNPFKFTDPDGRRSACLGENSCQVIQVASRGPVGDLGGAPRTSGKSSSSTRGKSASQSTAGDVETAVAAADGALMAQGMFRPSVQGGFVMGNAAMSQWKGATLPDLRAARQLDALSKVFGVASLVINTAHMLEAVEDNDMNAMMSSGTGVAFGIGAFTSSAGAAGAVTYGTTSLLLQVPSVYDAAVTRPLQYHERAIGETVENACAVSGC